MFRVKPGVIYFQKWCLFFGLLATGLGLFFIQPQAAWATTYTVNSTDDNNDGTCTHPFVNTANDCTMREAINASNANAGADTILIAIDSSFTGTSDGHGQQTTTVTTAYNSLTGQVTIDASGMWDTDENRPGFRMYSTSTSLAGLTFGAGAASSKIKGLEIQGYNAAINIGSTATGITIGSDCDGTTDSIERNVLHAASSHEIRILSSGVAVVGNYIGVDDDGVTVTGSTLYGVWLSGASADNNTVGYGEGKSCSAAIQRNIIGGTATVNGSAIRIEGTGTANTSGDSTLGPNGNNITGNYIGVGANGATAITNVGPGVLLVTNATLNFIGTDGDGVDDASEGNVISASSAGVFVSLTGSNRISGNTLGLNAAGTAAVANSTHGLNIRGVANIVGWCDVTIHSTLCTDSGTLAQQRNVISGNTEDGVRLGLGAYNTGVYGNYIGTGPDGITTMANGDNGVFIHRTNTGNSIGGASSNQTNLIQGHDAGVRLDGEFIGATGRGGSQSPLESNTIQNNTIQQNVLGIYNYWTENYSTDGPTDNTITSNTISNNTSYGIDVYGSSPSITNNTISSNGSYGIYIHPAFVTYDTDTEATTTDGDNPDNASSNLVSRPVVTGNSISSNTLGGIYQADSRANNYTTLYADNTIGNNSDQFDVKQDWVGTVEVLDRDGVPIPTSALASTAVTLTPAAGGSAATYSASDTTTASGLTQNIYGSSGIDYSQASTWPVITEYVIDSNGNQTSYGPYSITSTGTYASSSAATYSFDGTDNDTTYTSVLANGIATDSQYRYQIAKVLTSTTPATPSNISPTNESTTSNLTPTLSASLFSDASGDTHASSTWRVYSTSALCTAGNTADVVNTTSTTYLTSYTVSSGALQEATTYYWRVAYSNAFGNRSSFSTCTSFTTIRTTPSFSGSVPAQTLTEDTTLSNSFDLDTYFSDAEGESLTFSVLSTDTPDQITVSIDVNGLASFTPASNFSGSDTVTFRACDTDSQCTNSNSITLSVSAVNDAPLAPGAGFSPCCGSSTSDLTPEVSWTAATDVDDSASQLSYDFRLGTDADPVTTYNLTETTTAGVASVQISDSLEDETTYYFAVRTTDAAGLTSAWSEIQEFYVNTANLPELTLTKQASVSGTGWLFQLYNWAQKISVVLPWPLPALASHEAYSTYEVENTSSTHYIQQGDMVVSRVSPLGAIGVLTETLIGIFLLAFVVAFVILLRQSHKPKQFFALLFGNPASSFFNLFMGDNVTIEAISYAHFKAKLQLTRLLLVSTVIGVAALLVVHQVFAPSSSLAAKLASEASAGSVEPGDTVTLTLSYENTGDGDATNAVITDSIPSGTSYVSGSGSVNGAAQADTTFISGSTITLELGTISDRDSTGNSGTVSYQVTLDNPFDDSNVRFPVASLDANELSSPVLSNSVLFDVSGARIIGTVVDGTTGNGISSVELVLTQEGTTLDSDITNSEGAYSFSGLSDGTYRISVETIEGYDPVDARRVTVEAGEILNIDFELTLTAVGGGETNDNVNTNTNTNTNSNENLNGNQNVNVNENLNANENVNEGINENDNANTNTNGNENVNTDLNGNENTNQVPNTNNGEVEPDDQEPTPDEVEEDLPEIPGLTPEQEELKDELNESLGLISINDVSVVGSVVGVLGSNSLAGLPSEYADDLDKILLPAGTTEVVLSGRALPDSKVTITICSQAYVQVTQTDDTGTWNMIVPRELFEEGEHIAVASAEKDGITSDQLEIARFVVLDELLVTSRTALVLGLNILLLTLFVNLVLWGAKRSRSRQTDPLLPEATLSVTEQRQNFRRFMRAFILYALAIAAFVLVFFIPHPRLFDMRATVPTDAEKIVVTHVNQEKMIPGTRQHFRYVSLLHLEGVAPADTAIAITLCPGVTFRSTATGPNGEWALDIPLIVMPKGQFSMQGQFDVEGQLGIPHTIAEFKVANVQFLPRDYFLYGVSLLCVVLSMITLWSKARKPETDIESSSDIEPSDMPELD